MINDVLTLMNSAVSAVVTWFAAVIDATGTGTLYIAMMSVVLTIGILLTPLLGSARGGLDAGSDLAASWVKKVSSGRSKSTSLAVRDSSTDVRR